MICKYCDGQVLWRGAFSNLAHTQCTNCQSKNCQRINDDDDDDDDSETNEVTE